MISRKRCFYSLGIILLTSRVIEAQIASPSPSQTLPSPVAGTKITEAYARTVMRDAFFWAWPLVNIYNKRLVFSQIPEPGLMNGALPGAPLNHLCMLTDYILPSESWVACPNQDVVYGGGALALDLSPVVFQVPDFGKRFWVYQAVDLRTDSFIDLGSMYGSKPGYYLLVGPNWSGETPKGIVKVFRSKTNSGMVGPRVFVDDTAEDKRAVQELISQIDMYPLAEFDGKMKRHEWSKVPKFPAAESKEETRRVFPDKFVDQLPPVLRDAPPLPGEEARYAEMLAVIEAAKKDPGLKQAITDEVTKADKDLVGPLLQFRNWGIQLPNYWSTCNNGAAFGTDYFTRTAVAKSNILVNKPNEAKYYYQDRDASGTRLNGTSRYTATFAKGQTPPVKGFWSLTVYNDPALFRTKSDQPLFDRHKKQRPEDRRRRLSYYICAAGPAERSRAARELVTLTREQGFLAFPARLLGRAIRPQWQMDTASGGENEMIRDESSSFSSRPETQPAL